MLLKDARELNEAARPTCPRCGCVIEEWGWCLWCNARRTLRPRRPRDKAAQLALPALLEPARSA